MPGEREGKSDFQELSRIQESLRLDSPLFLRWPRWPDSVRPGCSWVLGQKGGRKPVKVLPTWGAAGGARVESEDSGRDRSAFEQFNAFSPAERGRAFLGREAWRRPGAQRSLRCGRPSARREACGHISLDRPFLGPSVLSPVSRVLGVVGEGGGPL